MNACANCKTPLRGGRCHLCGLADEALAYAQNHRSYKSGTNQCYWCGHSPCGPACANCNPKLMSARAPKMVPCGGCSALIDEGALCCTYTPHDTSKATVQTFNPNTLLHGGKCLCSGRPHVPYGIHCRKEKS